MAEEQAIIESEEEEDDDLQTTPRPTQEEGEEDDAESWNGFENDSTQEILGDDFQSFDDHMARTQPHHGSQADSWSIADDEPVRKNVRFDVSDSSDDSSEDENYGFPDLFVPQESLDAGFLRQIEQDDDDDQGSDSYWDFGLSQDHHHTRGRDESSDSDDASSESSDYDCAYSTIHWDSVLTSSSADEGDTTDEETWGPVAKTAPPRSVLRNQSVESGSEEEITIARRAPPRTPGGPLLGVWSTTPDKPFAVFNGDTEKLIMFKARCQPRPHSADGMIPNSGIPGLLPSAMDGPNEMSPMISNSANLMMSAMYTSLDEFVGDHALGPPEAFFPFVSISSDGVISQDTQSYSGGDDDFDDEHCLDDFINFGEDSDDNDAAGDDDQDESGSTTNDDSFPTPRRSSTAASEDQSQPMLFNPNLVGAFRNNQYRHKIMSRNNATDNSLLFSGPLAHTAVRGIKDGRMAAAGVAISPMRKQKVPRNAMQEASSPLAAQSKRKFSGEQQMNHGHKRSKSMH